jgi:putative heme iron utilization protein
MRAMPSRLEILVELLHSQDTAALATQSAALPGYPLATSVPFATDEHHRPLLLISALAEHTRNLAANPKAGFLVAKALGGGETARISMLGEVVPIPADAQLVARYRRYHPEAERFLQLGDFTFHRFEPQRVLVVGGFAQAGWLDGRALIDAPSLTGELEASLLETLRPDGLQLLGLDRYGMDVRDGGTRRRIAFANAPVTPEALPAALARNARS